MSVAIRKIVVYALFLVGGHYLEQNYLNLYKVRIVRPATIDLFVIQVLTNSKLCGII
jgi:hypothetical protein